MAVQTSVDGLRITGTMLRMIRVVDDQVRCEAGDELGLTEVSILGAIDRGHVLPSAVARLLRLDPARVTRTVDQLVGHGYVTRGADPTDRRRCPLGLTPDGKTRLEQARERIDRAMNSLLTSLDQGSRLSFAEAIEEVRRSLDSPV